MGIEKEMTMTKTDFQRRIGSPLFIAGLAVSLVNMNFASAALADTTKVTLPSGTVIPVQLNGPLSSKTNQPGDKFSATVKYGRDDAGIPEGTRVEGVVREALPSADGKPGVIDVDFSRIVFPGGDSRPLEASLYSLDGKAVKRTDGRLVATADKSKDRLKWAGIGAGAGVLLSVLTKGNAVVDALLGAGAGYLFNELQGKKTGDVALKQGAEFGVRLDRQLAFNADDRSYYRQSQTTGNVNSKLDRTNNPNYDRNNPNYNRSNPNYDRNNPHNDRTNPNNDRNNPNNDRNNPNNDRTNPNNDPNRDDLYYNANRTDGTDRRNVGREDAFNRDNRDNRDNLSGNQSGNGIGMMINDREVRFDNSSRPYMRGDIVYVPLVTVGKAAGFDYRYAAADKMIYARNNNIKLSTDSRIAIVNGQRRRLPAAPEVKNGTVYVPMQFIGWAASGSVAWDAGSRTVILTTDRDKSISR